MLDSKLYSQLRQKLYPDYRLYRHFNKKLDALVQGYGEASMARDVAEYDHVLLGVQEKCEFSKNAEGAANDLPVWIKDKVCLSLIK